MGQGSMKLRGISSCVSIPLHQIFHVLAECHGAEQDEHGHQIEPICNLHGPLWLYNSRVFAGSSGAKQKDIDT